MDAWTPAGLLPLGHNWLIFGSNQLMHGGAVLNFIIIFLDLTSKMILMS